MSKKSFMHVQKATPKGSLIVVTCQCICGISSIKSEFVAHPKLKSEFEAYSS